MIECKCGCGIMIKSKSYGRQISYAHGHNWRGKQRKVGLNPLIQCACGCGEWLAQYRWKVTGKRYTVSYQYGHNRRGASVVQFWKGGVTEAGKRFKASGQYKRWRKAVFERDSFTCQECGIRNQKGLGRTVELHADHIKPFAYYPELRTELSNGRTLCADCHRQTATYGPRVKQLMMKGSLHGIHST